MEFHFVKWDFLKSPLETRGIQGVVSFVVVFFLSNVPIQASITCGDKNLNFLNIKHGQTKFVHTTQKPA